MTHAELCPVCGGSGTYRKYHEHTYSTTVPNYTDQICHGCGGKGWIEIKDDCCCPQIPDPNPWYPYNPYPWYPNPWYEITCSGEHTDDGNYTITYNISS